MNRTDALKSLVSVRLSNIYQWNHRYWKDNWTTNIKGCINFFPEGSVVDDAAEAVSKTVSGSNSINKPLSDMSDSELASLGYKRYSDGSIRDSKGHFAGNSGTIPGTSGVDDW